MGQISINKLLLICIIVAVIYFGLPGIITVLGWIINILLPLAAVIFIVGGIVTFAYHVGRQVGRKNDHTHKE